MCEFYGWRVSDVMQMNAVTFFAMAAEASEVKKHRDAINYIQLCDIAGISFGDEGWYKEIRSRYLRMLPGEPEVRRRGALNPDDPKAQIMLAHMISKYRQALNV